MFRKYKLELRPACSKIFKLAVIKRFRISDPCRRSCPCRSFLVFGTTAVANIALAAATAHIRTSVAAANDAPYEHPRRKEDAQETVY